MKKAAKGPSPIELAFTRQLEYLATTLRPSTVSGYRTSIRSFLNHLNERYPDIRRTCQLQRDPHILSWLVALAAHEPPLSVATRIHRIIHLRRLLDQIAAGNNAGVSPGLFLPDDLPRQDHYLPRPLAPNDDAVLQQGLQQRDDLWALALLLMRHTGIRIGECADLSMDCLRSLGGARWALHVPVGKLHSERLVPVDDYVRQLILRIRYLRTLPLDATGDQPDEQFLLPRTKGRCHVMAQLRGLLLQVVWNTGTPVHVTPHQLRHTYATDMLRAGASFPAVMKMLGHSSPRMTLQYVEVNQDDLQREYLIARRTPRHTLAPHESLTPTGSPDPTHLSATLEGAKHALEMSRRDAPASLQPKLKSAANRLAKLIDLIKSIEKSAEE